MKKNLLQFVAIIIALTSFVYSKGGELNFNASQTMINLDNMSYETGSFFNVDGRYFVVQQPNVNIDINVTSFFNTEHEDVYSEERYSMQNSLSIYGNKTVGNFTPEILASYWNLNQKLNYLYPIFVDASLQKKDAIYGGVGVSAYNSVSVRGYYKTNSYAVQEDSDSRRLSDVLSRLKVTTPTLFSNTHIALTSDYQQPITQSITYADRENALIYNNYVKSHLAIIREDNIIKSLDAGIGINYFYNSEYGYTTNVQPMINYRKKIGNANLNLSYENFFSTTDQYIIKQYAEVSLYNNDIDKDLNSNGFLLKLRLTDFRAHVSPTFRVNYRKHFGSILYVKPKLLLHYSTKFSNNITNSVYTVDEIEIGRKFFKGFDAFVSPNVSYVVNEENEIMNFNVQAGAKYNF